MTTPTNWPNPALPGFPLFPERDGWHLVAFKKKHPRSAYWNSKKQAWSHAYKDMISASNMGAKGRLYYGPFLSITQISGMLAGERERCAAACDKLADDFLPCHPSEFSTAIRRLGAAS